MYKFYLVTHNNKKYKVKAENEDAAIAKVRLCLENKDQELFSTNISDNTEGLLHILGGIAASALESKRLLQSNPSPKISESAGKMLATLGVDMAVAGEELSNLISKSMNIKKNRR